MNPVKLSLILIIALFNAVSGKGQSQHLGEQFSQSIIRRYQPNIDVMTHKGWDHSNSIILHGMEKIYEHTNNPAYLNYIRSFADAFINADGTIKGMAPALDRIHPGMICLFLFEKTGEIKYKAAAKYLRDYLVGSETSPSVFKKTPEGGYWHKNELNYQDVMTVDGIYMAYPFLVKYGKLFNDTVAINVAVSQTLLIASHSFNITNNLPYHAWDYSKSKPWANPITGTSSIPWSRSVGWFSMALVDILENLSPSHKDFGTVLYLFKQLALGIRECQHTTDGLWYQVVNCVKCPGNYPEISGSGMIVYAIRKGVNNKWIDPAFKIVAEKGWQGIKNNIRRFSDGMPQVVSVAPGMGCKKSYEEYVTVRPVSCPSEDEVQHPHGYCAVLMASSVMEY